MKDIFKNNIKKIISAVIGPGAKSLTVHVEKSKKELYHIASAVFKVLRTHALSPLVASPNCKSPKSYSVRLPTSNFFLTKWIWSAEGANKAQLLSSLRQAQLLQMSLPCQLHIYPIIPRNYYGGWIQYSILKIKNLYQFLAFK